MGEVTNSNPEDNNGGAKPSAESIKDWIKKHYRGGLSQFVQTNNPFNIKRSGQGKGLDPRWNPSETGKEYDTGGSGSGSGPGSNSGSASGWLKSMAKRGGQNNDDDQNSSDTTNARPELGTNGSIRPERVNPVPFFASSAKRQVMSYAAGRTFASLPGKGSNLFDNRAQYTVSHRHQIIRPIHSGNIARSTQTQVAKTTKLITTPQAHQVKNLTSPGGPKTAHKSKSRPAAQVKAATKLQPQPATHIKSGKTAPTKTQKSAPVVVKNQRPVAHLAL